MMKSIINFEKILDEFHDTIVAGTLRNGDKFSGRLEQFDGVFLKLVNRSGKRVVVPKVANRFDLGRKRGRGGVNE